MVEAFLRYSLLHNRPVKVLFAGDPLKYHTITVIGMEGDRLSYLTARKKTPVTIEISEILTAGYARGDHGDPLENAAREGKL